MRGSHRGGMTPLGSAVPRGGDDERKNPLRRLRRLFCQLLRREGGVSTEAKAESGSGNRGTEWQTGEETEEAVSASCGSECRNFCFHSR